MHPAHIRDSQRVLTQMEQILGRGTKYQISNTGEWIRFGQGELEHGVQREKTVFLGRFGWEM